MQKKYNPKKVIEIIPDCDKFDEDKYTLKYMEKYGIENVRGGTFCEIVLKKDNLSTIKKMIDSSSDKCYICGDTDHFAKDCNQDENKIYETYEFLDINEKKTSVVSEKNIKKNITHSTITFEKNNYTINMYSCDYCSIGYDNTEGVASLQRDDNLKSLNIHKKNECRKKNKNYIDYTITATINFQ